MHKEFSLLEDDNVHNLIRDRRAATVLYHLLGGKEEHEVMVTRRVSVGTSISHEMLAKDKNGLCHAMAIRLADSLTAVKEFREHWMADLWEYTLDGRECACEPATRMLVYFLRNKLPEDRQVCRVGFLLMPDDIDINVELPTQIISTVADDSSELANLVQYLKCPVPHRAEYGALADRIDVLLSVQETRKNEE
jgi:hypothetical protein